MAAHHAPSRSFSRPWSIAILAAAACLAGCSSTTLQASPSPAISPTPPGSAAPDTAVDDTGPTAVSRAALSLMWTIDYRADHAGQHDAYLRALPLLTPQFATRLRSAPPGPPPPDAWIRKHARTRLRLQPGDEDRPADSATTAYRQWLLTVTTLDSAGHRQLAPVHVTAYVILTRPAGQPWRVAQASTY